LPRIIRSTGVNLERARPLVVQPKGQAKAQTQAQVQAQAQAQAQAQSQARAKADLDALLRAAEADKLREMEKIHASAEIIVEEILSKARNDADNMLVDAREETVKVLHEAVREGREQGMGEALKEMRALEGAMKRELEDAVNSLLEERRTVLEGLEPEILELVFDIVGKVLDVQMDRSDEWICSMVKTALRQMEGDDSAVMRVSAGARKRVSEVAARMLEAAGKAGSLTVVADASLPPGGCVIDTGRGIIDTGVEGKLERLKTVLKENA
jgi:flagellar assembly protein FliH